MNNFLFFLSIHKIYREEAIIGFFFEGGCYLENKAFLAHGCKRNRPCFFVEDDKRGYEWLIVDGWCKS